MLLPHKVFVSVQYFVVSVIRVTASTGILLECWKMINITLLFAHQLISSSFTTKEATIAGSIRSLLGRRKQCKILNGNAFAPIVPSCMWLDSFSFHFFPMPQGYKNKRCSNSIPFFSITHSNSIATTFRHLGR